MVMVFSLTNTPVAFMDLMNSVFKRYLNKFIVVFIDNILLYSKDRDEHTSHLRTVLEILSEHQLYEKLKTCQFSLKEVIFLVHIISNEGIKGDPQKVKAITKWPRPNNVTKIRSFLGITGYHQMFMENFSKITSFMTNLL